MSSSLYHIGIILFGLVLTVQGSFYVYTYNNGTSEDKEHCCLVKLDEDFCLAKPLTRSLIQVNKDCQRLGANEKTTNYLKKIVRRLYVETSAKVGKKIVLELKAPLDDDLLQDDLLCLAAENNNINLEKCYVESVSKQSKKSKQKKNETADESLEEQKSVDENRIRRVELTESIRIRKGHGLSVRQFYTLNLTKTHRSKRQCWSWYTKNTKKICNHPTTSAKSCISLNKQGEKYLEQITSNTYSMPIGSKLYCEDTNKRVHLLGYHRRSEVCFQTNHQLYVEHRFTDFVSLSDEKKNNDVLGFISNNTKLTREFEKDCQDKTTLVDIKKVLEKEAESIAVDEQTATQDDE